VSKRDELFAAVYAEPDSDEPRIVLADYLMQEGDPRGDFIAKQLSGDDAGAEALLASHGAEWLGSLRPFTRRAQFRRGFPTRLELVEVVRPGRIDLDALAADPALGTIEDLLSGHAHHDVYGRLTASPKMTALRRIEIRNRQALVWLRKSRAKITHAACALPMPWSSSDHEPTLAFLNACERRADVSSLTMNDRVVELVLASPIVERLTALAIAGADKKLPELLSRLPRHFAVSLVPFVGLELCIAVPEKYKPVGAIDLVRDGERMIARAWGDWADRVIRSTLVYLPGLARLEFRGRAEELEELERTARLFHIELVVLPELPRHGYVDLGGLA
jgi:uncharacterized protein (TIGR02996 family)